MNERKLDKAVTAAAKLAGVVTLKPGAEVTMKFGDGTVAMVKVISTRGNQVRIVVEALDASGKALTVGVARR